eukprot:scaffold825_cov249-Pinguiococcus_pyrenoidosus.AAC.46
MLPEGQEPLQVQLHTLIECQGAGPVRVLREAQDSGSAAARLQWRTILLTDPSHHVLEATQEGRQAGSKRLVEHVAISTAFGKEHAEQRQPLQVFLSGKGKWLPVLRSRGLRLVETDQNLQKRVVEVQERDHGVEGRRLFFSHGAQQPNKATEYAMEVLQLGPRPSRSRGRVSCL